MPCLHICCMLPPCPITVEQDVDVRAEVMLRRSVAPGCFKRVVKRSAKLTAACRSEYVAGTRVKSA